MQARGVMNPSFGWSISAPNLRIGSDAFALLTGMKTCLPLSSHIVASLWLCIVRFGSSCISEHNFIAGHAGYLYAVIYLGRLHNCLVVRCFS